MTPKEEAKELISKFTFLKIPENKDVFYNPKQCALIAVSEFKSNSFDIESAIKMDFPSNYKTYEYWLEVEKELASNNAN